MHELMDFLMGELNSAKEPEYIIRHDGVDGQWFLKDVDIPVADDEPLTATWTKSMTEALKFGNVELVHDFAIAHLMPRPCTIIQMEN